MPEEDGKLLPSCFFGMRRNNLDITGMELQQQICMWWGKRITAAESCDSLCTWRGRYAGSCAADRGASQNDLSVGAKRGVFYFLKSYTCSEFRQWRRDRHEQFAACTCLNVSECLSLPEYVCRPELRRVTEKTGDSLLCQEYIKMQTQVFSLTLSVFPSSHPPSFLPSIFVQSILTAANPLRMQFPT